MLKERKISMLSLADSAKAMVFLRRRQSPLIARLRINTKTNMQRRGATMSILRNERGNNRLFTNNLSLALMRKFVKRS